jgi:kumamolisin
VPDVSADADPASGYSIYCSGNSSYCTGWGEIGGTSAAAPLWAGIAADINQYLLAQKQTPLGHVDVALYTLYNTSQPYAPYHDVTTGTNLYYQAGPGYDLATGIGTPNAWNIARDIAGITGGTPTPTPVVTLTPTPVVTLTPTPVVTLTPIPVVTLTPTPGPIVTPTPGGLTTQLLQNGGFEQGNMGWGQRSVRGYNFINQVNPHTGRYSADLCGYANCNDALYQTVNLPRTTTHVTLSYWVYTGNRSTSTSCSSEFYAILSTANGSPLALVQILCNTDAHGWTHYSFDLSSILAKDAGQPIQLYFNARAFTQSAASFYVDDVAFNVTTSS